MHLIDVRDVYKIYNPGENQVNALDGVSITIDEGEFVAIIGQSGSGKSTLMNMLGLLDTPTSGEYYINGNLVDDLTDDQMSEIRNEQIGFIFQGFNLISSLNAIENVELPLVYRGIPKTERRAISEAALKRLVLIKECIIFLQHSQVVSSSVLLLPVPLRLLRLLFLPMSQRVTLTHAQQRMLCRFCTILKMKAEPLLLLLTIMKLPSRQSVLSV